MKKFLIITLAILGAFLFKIPEYRELNDLAIIEGIAVYYDGNNYTVYLREVIPIKSEQGIDYEQKYYKSDANTVEKCYKKITENTAKKLYLKRCKVLITNLYTSEDILESIDINPKYIYHSMDDVYKLLKEI